MPPRGEREPVHQKSLPRRFAEGGLQVAAFLSNPIEGAAKLVLKPLDRPVRRLVENVTRTTEARETVFFEGEALTGYRTRGLPDVINVAAATVDAVKSLYVRK